MVLTGLKESVQWKSRRFYIEYKAFMPLQDLLHKRFESVVEAFILGFCSVRAGDKNLLLQFYNRVFDLCGAECLGVL